MFQSVLTVDEVAAVLRVSRHTVYRLAERGELPGRRVGRVWRFSKEGIDRYLLGEGNVAPKNTREDGNASQ